MDSLVLRQAVHGLWTFTILLRNLRSRKSDIFEAVTYSKVQHIMS